jgi:nitrile hydratase accessory protein
MTERLPADTGDDTGAGFEAPWQARLHALSQLLIERGAITPEERAQALGDAIARAQAAGDPDRGDTYWQHYLAALEDLVARKGLA